MKKFSFAGLLLVLTVTAFSQIAVSANSESGSGYNLITGVEDSDTLLTAIGSFILEKFVPVIE